MAITTWAGNADQFPPDGHWAYRLMKDANISKPACCESWGRVIGKPLPDASGGPVAFVAIQCTCGGYKHGLEGGFEKYVGMTPAKYRKLKAGVE